MEDIRRKLSKDIDISTMLSMREQGMTNKQIADALGVAPTTVYRYIGRMSQAVKYAEVQNKPSPISKMTVEQPECEITAPVPEKPTHTHDVNVPAPTEVEEKTVEHQPARPPMQVAPAAVNCGGLGDSLLRVISTRSTLQGSLCNYVVDSETGTIEMTDGIITGLLDRDTVQRFIAELQEASKLIG